MSDEKRYTLAEVREKERDAFVRGAALMGGDRSSAEALAHHPGYYPDPERPTVDSGAGRYRIGDSGVMFEYWDEGARLWRVSATSVAHVAALASLLPRVPVTVTEEMVEKGAEVAFDARGFGTTWAQANPAVRGAWRSNMRLALSAVAADLAQPVHACQHKAKQPTRWMVEVSPYVFRYFSSETTARYCAERLDEQFPKLAPHRIIALAEVVA